jgi:hypothetical protein
MFQNDTTKAIIGGTAKIAAMISQHDPSLL